MRMVCSRAEPYRQVQDDAGFSEDVHVRSNGSHESLS